MKFQSNLPLLNNGKFYSFKKVFTLVFCNKFLVNFQSIFSLICERIELFSNKVFTLIFFNRFLVNFQSNLAHLFNFIFKIIFLRKRECFAFKPLILNNGRVYSFNKFFTLVFFEQWVHTSFGNKFLVNFLSNLLLLNNGKFYSFKKVCIIAFFTSFQLHFTQF